MNRSREVWRHPIVTVLGSAVLLGVVAIGVRGRSWDSGSSQTRHLPPAFWDYVFSGVAVVWLVFGLYAMHLFLSMRAQESKGYGWRNAARAFLLFTAVLLVMTLLISRLHHRPHLLSQHGQTFHPNGQGSGSTGDLPGRSRRDGTFRWQSAAGTGAVLVVLAAIVILAGRRRRPRVTHREAAAEALARLVDDTLDDLRRERDPRKAVIAAYARMEQTLAAFGLPRDPAEAPNEYLRRMLAELQVSGTSARRLTDLFEWARFSSHEVDAAMKDEAIDALVALRGELVPAA